MRLLVALWLMAGSAVAQEACDERKLERLERRLKTPRPGNYALAANGLADACGSALPDGFGDILRTYARSPNRSTALIVRELLIQGFGASVPRLLCYPITPPKRADLPPPILSPNPNGPLGRGLKLEELPQAEDTYSEPGGPGAREVEPVRTTVAFAPWSHPVALRAFDRCGMDTIATRKEAGGGGAELATPGLQIAGALVSVLDGVPPMRRRVILRALAGLDAPAQSALEKPR